VQLEFHPQFAQLAQLEFAASVLNRFHWSVTVEYRDNEVWLRGGEVLIARFASTEELEVFATGMALALAVLPEEVVEVLDRIVGE